MTLPANCTIVLFPAPDVPGRWVAHCLELDVVPQGDAPENALKMLDEAVAILSRESPGVPYKLLPKGARERIVRVWRAARAIAAALLPPEDFESWKVDTLLGAIERS